MNGMILNDQKIHTLDKFVKKILEAYKSDAVDLEQAVWAIGHVFSAIDQRNETEVMNFPKNWKP